MPYLEFIGFHPILSEIHKIIPQNLSLAVDSMEQLNSLRAAGKKCRQCRICRICMSHGRQDFLTKIKPCSNEVVTWAICVILVHMGYHKIADIISFKINERNCYAQV